MMSIQSHCSEFNSQKILYAEDRAISVLEKINVGIVGIAGRGGSLRTALRHGGVRVHAVCDIRENKLEPAKHLF